jgi:hypothetical protein
MSGCSLRTEETIGGGNNGGRVILKARGKGRGRKGDVVVEFSYGSFKEIPYHTACILRFSSGSHELSSWGNPFHFTRNCFFPCLF